MMRRCFTNALDAYDYSYCVPAGEYTGLSGNHGRLVDIPAESYAYQTARYCSGPYFAVEILN